MWHQLDKQNLSNDKHKKAQSLFILFLLAVVYTAVEALGDITSLPVTSRVIVSCVFASSIVFWLRTWPCASCCD
jgi:Flp pilus assembly protein protease CpaA